MNLTVSNVFKTFKTAGNEELKVLKNVNVNLNSGSVLRLKGPSGSGKSTLLNIISGLILPDKGSVTINGIEINSLKEGRRDKFRAENIGYIFQTFNLLTPFSVYENIIAPLAFAGRLPENFEEKARSVLKEVGLSGYEKQKTYHLSVGQRQRVSIARVLFQKPSILLADEPTASLDKKSAKTIFESIVKMRDAGSTIVLASHDSIFDDFRSDKTIDFENGGES